MNSVSKCFYTLVSSHRHALLYSGSVPRSFLTYCRRSVPVRSLTRSMWLLCRGRDTAVNRTSAWGKTCACGCSDMHTKGDKELYEFLQDEIQAEAKTRKTSSLPKIEGFETKVEGADVTLTKKFNGEMITVKLNVNHSVDAEEPAEINQQQDKAPETSEMKAKPNFTVEIEKGGKVLAFNCTFADMMEEEETQDSYNDAFQISELSIHNGDWNDCTYSVSGNIMDGYFYDLLMNLLEERGISNEFADKLVEYCTSYEHKLYIELLQGIRSFVGGK